MRLSPEQMEQFRTEGWLLLPELFTPEEVDVLRREAVSIYDQHRPEVWREKNGAPRTAFAALRPPNIMTTGSAPIAWFG